MNATPTNVTLDAVELEAARKRTERDLPYVEKFATTERSAVPARLRAPYKRTEWVGLAPAVRREHLAQTVLAQNIERELQRKAAKLEKARATPGPSTPAPASGAPDPAPALEAATATDDVPTTPSRYVVACADGCGVMVPARGPRPVVAYAEPWHRPRPKARRRLEA